MSTPPVLSLRDAVLSLVRPLPALAPCGGRVFDAVPAKATLAVLPHVSCGPASLARAENGDHGLPMLRLRLFVASDHLDRDQAWTMAHAMAEALEGAMPELGGGYHLIDVLRVAQMGDVLDKISPNEVFLDVVTTAQAD